MYRPGFNYVKAGVMLVDLRPRGRTSRGELDLFGGAEQQSRRRGAIARS